MKVNCKQIKADYEALMKRAAGFGALVEKIRNEPYEREKVRAARQEQKNLAAAFSALREKMWVTERQAQETLGKDFLGTAAIEKTWGYRPEQLPPIKCSRAELKQMKELGQVLVYYVDRTKDNKELSIEEQNKAVEGRWKKEGKGKLLGGRSAAWKNWLKEGYTSGAPRSGWWLVTKKCIPDSKSKDYIAQTEVMIQYLREKVFTDPKKPMPKEYEEAIKEFETRKEKLTALAQSDWKKAGKELSGLRITQLCRQRTEEGIYLAAMYMEKNGERLLEDEYLWGSSLSPAGNLVRLGAFDNGGVSGADWRPGNQGGKTGVCLARRL